MPGRPTDPLAVAEAKGAVLKNPQNYKKRKRLRVKSLGPPPSHLNERQQEIWHEWNEDAFWLGRTDRGVVCMAVILAYKMEVAPYEMSAAEVGNFRSYMKDLGMTPVDRGKVYLQDEEDEDPAEQFFN